MRISLNGISQLASVTKTDIFLSMGKFNFWRVLKITRATTHISIVTSVCLSAWNNSDPTRRIFVNLACEYF